MTFNVLVVDRNTERGGALAIACIGCSNDSITYNVHTYSSENNLTVYCSEFGYFDDATNNPESWSLILRHYSDDDLEIIPTPEFEIWYGGGGARPEKGKEWNIYRTLNSENDVNQELLPNLLSEMLRFALADDRSDLPIPDLLKPYDNVETVAALSILCQGFLTVYSSTFGIEECKKIQAALERMGWTEFLQGEGSSLIENVVLSGKWDGDDGVSNPKWWTDALGENQESAQGMIEKEMGKELPDSIQRLIDSIYGKTDIEAEAVAETFIAITDRLEKSHDEGTGD